MAAAVARQEGHPLALEGADDQLVRGRPEGGVDRDADHVARSGIWYSPLPPMTPMLACSMRLRSSVVKVA